jgi:hypothetical protein
MSLYPAYATDDKSAPDLLTAGMALAVRAADLTLPTATGQARTGMVVAGTPKICTGDDVVWFVPVVATKARTRRDGCVQAAGRAFDHTSLGHAETLLDELTGAPGVIDRIAATITPGRRIKNLRRRSMNTATTIRAVLLMTLMPHAGYRQILDHLFGDLARLPWERPFKVPSPTTLTIWRAAIGTKAFTTLLEMVLAGTRAAHADAAWALFEAGGLLVGAIDGTVTRMKDTPANRLAYGAATDNSPFPQIRHLHITDAVTRSALAVPCGPCGGDKAAAEQALLDQAVKDTPETFTPDRIWLMDRNYPGAPRIARLLRTGTHVLIRLKSDIRLDRVGGFLPDGSWIADIHGDGVTVRMRVVEYVVELDGKTRPDSYCLITDLHDHERWPARMLAALYPRRWDGSETSLKENKSTIHDAGPSTGAILRSGTPQGITQEHAAWTVTCEITRALLRRATQVAPPIDRGPRTGQAITPRDLSFTRARAILISHVRPLPTDLTHLLQTVAATRGQPDRHRHRDRVTKAAPAFPHRSTTPTRTQKAVVHAYGTPPARTGDDPATPGDTVPTPTPGAAVTHPRRASLPVRTPRPATQRRPRPPGPPPRPTRRPRALTIPARRT